MHQCSAQSSIAGIELPVAMQRTAANWIRDRNSTEFFVIEKPIARQHSITEEATENERIVLSIGHFRRRSCISSDFRRTLREKQSKPDIHFIRLIVLDRNRQRQSRSEIRRQFISTVVNEFVFDLCTCKADSGLSVTKLYYYLMTEIKLSLDQRRTGPR